MKIRQIIVPALASAILLGACGVNKNTSSRSKFIDKNNMDLSIHPGDDFFMYANGSWINNTTMPGDKTRWGSFDELAENTSKMVKDLLEGAKVNSKDVKESNIAKFYKSGMNTEAIDKLGLDAIKEELQMIDNISNTQQLLSGIARLQTKGIGSVIGMYVGPDDKDVNTNTISLYQTGLGLPNKDYYTDTDERSVNNRNAYKQYIQEILKLSGVSLSDAERKSEKIFDIESQLAAASLRPQEMRDPQKMYNKFTLAELNKKTPNINWNGYLNSVNIKNHNEVIVGTVSYYEKLSQMLTKVDINDWKSYLKYHLISDMAPYLSSNFSTAHFNFYNKQLRGQKEQTPRWKRVLGVIDGSIGDQLGQLYVEKHFKPEAKTRMMEMVNNLGVAFAERINDLDWMSAPTKQKALLKLNSFVKKIGYPDKWKDYSGLHLTADNYAKNILLSHEYEYNYNISKLGKAVDKQEWFMTPNTVNAYYNPAFNEIVFPAAILQFPFFDFNADDAINYGGIGAVIGHEMTHGFDDQGAQYAADGNLSNWWTEEDEKKFKAKTKVLVNQYNEYKVLDSIPVNGELTLGENIADLGGVAIAYQAFKKTKQGQSGAKIDGFTPDQRFFLSWAQVWRNIVTPETAINLIKTDPHSPGSARANLPLSNFEPFYKAFDVKEHHKMYIPVSKRAKIW